MQFVCNPLILMHSMTNDQAVKCDSSDVPLNFGDPRRPLLLAISVLDTEFWYGHPHFGYHSFIAF